jgi:ribosome-binding protein aMBF1 (putative translation factor)
MARSSASGVPPGQRTSPASTERAVDGKRIHLSRACRAGQYIPAPQHLDAFEHRPPGAHRVAARDRGCKGIQAPHQRGSSAATTRPSAATRSSPVPRPRDRRRDHRTRRPAFGLVGVASARGPGGCHARCTGPRVPGCSARCTQHMADVRRVWADRIRTERRAQGWDQPEMARRHRTVGAQPRSLGDAIIEECRSSWRPTA